jgi:hypothetical protein
MPNLKTENKASWTSKLKMSKEEVFRLKSNSSALLASKNEGYGLGPTFTSDN